MLQLKTDLANFSQIWPDNMLEKVNVNLSGNSIVLKVLFLNCKSYFRAFTPHVFLAV